MVYLYEESLLIRDQISSLLLSVSSILLWNSYVPQSPLILFRHCHCLSHFQIHPTGKVQFGFIVLMFSMRRLIPLKRSWTDCCVFYDTALRTICSNCFRLLSSLTLETADFETFFFLIQIFHLLPWCDVLDNSLIGASGIVFYLTAQWWASRSQLPHPSRILFPPIVQINSILNTILFQSNLNNRSLLIIFTY